jgi:superfamily II DNA or RNA helicase
MLKLRPYQEDILTAVDAELSAGNNRPAVVAATGLGKTVTFSRWITTRCAERPRERTLVLVHRDELASQARNKIHQMAPALRPGIVMGAQRGHDRQVVIASVATIRNTKRRDQLHSVGSIVVDEAHHAAADTWRETLRHFGAFDGVPTIGFTATLSRQDGKGLGEIWSSVIHRPDGGFYDTLWGIQNGYLSDARGIRVRVPDLQVTDAMTRGGGANEAAGVAMLDANTGQAIVKAIHEFAPERRGVVFAPNVDTAEQFAAEMNANGIRTGVILGTTGKEERSRIYRDFESGALQWLTNAMVLTEGWDAPWCDCIVIARPTKSSGLYQQMVGRGLRLWAAGGKQDCLVLDVVGATELHGLASLADLSPDKQIRPRENQSLLEALDEFDADEFEQVWDTPPPAPVHKVVGTAVDLFGQSHSVWLQTRKGTWFIPAGDSLFFLWPDGAGTYTIGQTSKQRSEPALPLQADVDLELGMAIAEGFAAEYAPETAGKDAAWRGQGPMTQGQRAELYNWNVLDPARKTPPKWSTAKAYDEINIAIASWRLDGIANS